MHPVDTTSTHDTRSAILAVARRAFALKGFEAIGVQQICDSAGVTKPTLYYHFQSKRGLLKAVCTDAVRSFLGALAPDSEDPGTLRFSGDIVSEIRTFLSRIAAFGCSEKERYALIVQILYAPPDSALGTVAAEDRFSIVSAFENYFRSAVGAHGNIRGKEPILAATFIGHAGAVTALSAVDCESATPDSPRIIQAAQSFLYGIF
jgi:AcrR family transcriptional regulator